MSAKGKTMSCKAMFTVPDYKAAFSVCRRGKEIRDFYHDTPALPPREAMTLAQYHQES